LISAPEDREPAVRKIIEKAGGKVLNFYFTTGETDFLLVTETEEAENIIAALMAAAATGSVSHVTNVRAPGQVRNSNQLLRKLPKQRVRTDLRARSADCTHSSLA
jgi:uncharacterized protein with GYD domain